MNIFIYCMCIVIMFILISVSVFVYVGYDYGYWISGVLYIVFYVVLVSVVVVCLYSVYKYINCKKLILNQEFVMIYDIFFFINKVNFFIIVSVYCDIFCKIYDFMMV